MHIAWEIEAIFDDLQNNNPGHAPGKENYMLNNTTLGDLIKWLEKQDPEMEVLDGFSTPHSDRGSYDELAFTPEPKAKIKDMLYHAQSALEATFEGYKGGEYKMTEYTPVYIGVFGSCGNPITPIHFKYWKLTGGTNSE
jgi:hypothetical protein